MTQTASKLALALASLVLAIAPAQWLWRSWQDPSYASHGAWYASALAALVALSLRSGPAPKAPTAGLILLFATAAVARLAGQILAINILSALALAIDVYALARLLRLDARPLPLSPGWLSALFLFTLPLAKLIERTLGFPLQRVSAEIACQFLTPAFAELHCEATRLQVNGLDVLVDLPCSGATGVMLLMALWVGLNSLYRPSLTDAAKGAALFLTFAVMSNGLRIALLAGGLAKGLNTMEPSLHSSIGLATLALAAGLSTLLYQPQPAPSRPKRSAKPRSVPLPAAGAALALSLLITQVPHAPADLSGPVTPPSLPTQIMGHRGQPMPLNPYEEHYFARFGGTATKATYGPLGLNIVRTNSPLRHLHAPAKCLLGMGYDVRFLGTRFEPLPTSVYEATAPDGTQWHVAVSFTSAQGQTTASVGEAVWSWLSTGSGQWQSVQRITPATLPPSTRQALEQQALAALDL